MPNNGRSGGGRTHCGQQLDALARRAHVCFGQARIEVDPQCRTEYGQKKKHHKAKAYHPSHTCSPLVLLLRIHRAI